MIFEAFGRIWNTLFSPSSLLPVAWLLLDHLCSAPPVNSHLTCYPFGCDETILRPLICQAFHNLATLFLRRASHRGCQGNRRRLVSPWMCKQRRLQYSLTESGTEKEPDGRLVRLRKIIAGGVLLNTRGRHSARLLHACACVNTDDFRPAWTYQVRSAFFE